MPDGSVAHLGMVTTAARWPVARGSAAPAPRPRPIAPAGHFMIVSSSGQIAPKSAHDHETRSPPGTRAAMFTDLAGIHAISSSWASSLSRSASSTCSPSGQSSAAIHSDRRLSQAVGANRPPGHGPAPPDAWWRTPPSRAASRSRPTRASSRRAMDPRDTKTVRPRGYRHRPAGPRRTVPGLVSAAVRSSRPAAGRRPGSWRARPARRRCRAAGSATPQFRRCCRSAGPARWSPARRARWPAVAPPR